MRKYELEFKETYKRFFLANLDMGLNAIEANINAADALMSLARHLNLSGQLIEQMQETSFYIPSHWTAEDVNA